MKTIAKLGLAVALVVGLVAGATAGDEMTLTGKVMCAKCTLKKADAKECQDVLVVKDGDKTSRVLRREERRSGRSSATSAAARRRPSSPAR